MQYLLFLRFGLSLIDEIIRQNDLAFSCWFHMNCILSISLQLCYWLECCHFDNYSTVKITDKPQTHLCQISLHSWDSVLISDLLGRIQLSDAVWICDKWCCIKGSEESRAGNLIKGEYHYSKWEMASPQDVARKLKWLLRSPSEGKSRGTALSHHLFMVLILRLP